MIEMLEGVKETVSFREHFGIRMYLNVEAENYPLHWHTAAEIIMPLENRYTAIVGDATHILRPDDIFIIPSGELHQLIAPDSGKRLIMQFDCSLLYALSGFESTFHLLRPCLVVTPERHGELHASLKPLLIGMMNEYFGDSTLKEASSYALLIQFFVHLGRNLRDERREHCRTKSHKQHKYIDSFVQVCSYISEHCTEDIRVDDLAGLAGFSKFHFARLFKQYVGTSYYNYLNQNRVKHAEKLLIDPNLPITEIAMRSGFGSLATFNRVFKNYKKCTPTEYKHLYGGYGLRR